MSVTFKSNMDVILKQVSAASADAIEKAKEVMVEAVQWQMLYGYKDRHGPDGHTEIVDTGALYDSIKGEVKRDSQNAYTATVSTDRPYAVYVHEGTRKLKARRFMRDGLQKQQKKIQDAIADAYKKVGK